MVLGWQKQCLQRLATRRRKPLGMFHARTGEIIPSYNGKGFLVVFLLGRMLCRLR